MPDEAAPPAGAGDSHLELVNRLPAALFRSTPGGRLLLVDQAFATIFGFDSPADLRDVPATDLYVDPADRMQVLEGEDGPRELRMKRRDGSPIGVRTTIHVVRNAEGDAEFFEGVIEDVSARRQAEAALAASEELFRTSFEDAPRAWRS